MSSLAEGADQIFAAHVLAAGGTLEVILPCQDYASSLVTDESRARFYEFRRAAATVITLPYPRPSEQAFLAGGQALVERCDHLLAIWDGRPPAAWAEPPTRRVRPARAPRHRAVDRRRPPGVT